MNEFLSGKKLFGDDFTLEQIEQWYKDETEAYADLGARRKLNIYTGLIFLIIYMVLENLRT